jgi:hypothetical protein
MNEPRRSDAPSTEKISVLLDLLIAILTERVKGKDSFIVPTLNSIADEVTANDD